MCPDLKIYKGDIKEILQVMLHNDRDPSVPRKLLWTSGWVRENDFNRLKTNFVQRFNAKKFTLPDVMTQMGEETVWEVI